MTQRNQIYKCKVCGNIVEVIHSGVGELVCCGQPMILMEEKKEEVGQEKHVPVIQETDEGIKVTVGSNPHPMEQEHYIEWIQVISGGESHRKFLKPGEKPEATFRINKEEVEKVREFCNIHGLWRTN